MLIHSRMINVTSGGGCTYWDDRVQWDMSITRTFCTQFEVATNINVKQKIGFINLELKGRSKVKDIKSGSLV